METQKEGLRYSRRRSSVAYSCRRSVVAGLGRSGRGMVWLDLARGRRVSSRSGGRLASSRSGGRVVSSRSGGRRVSLRSGGRDGGVAGGGAGGGLSRLGFGAAGRGTLSGSTVRGGVKETSPVSLTLMCQLSRWMRWWQREHSRTALVRSVVPWSRCHQAMWWASTNVVCPHNAHPPSRSHNARTWARVKVRVRRPRSNGSEGPPNTAGINPASQASRRAAPALIG